jgi:hypothetical protein
MVAIEVFHYGYYIFSYLIDLYIPSINLHFCSYQTSITSLSVQLLFTIQPAQQSGIFV